MKLTRPLTAAAMAVSSLGLATLLGGPAVSTAKPAPTPSPTPPPPDAVGCYDIVPSNIPGPKYRRFVDEINGTPATTSTPVTPTYSGYTVTLSNNGVVHADVPLGGAACVDATYIVSVYDTVGGAAIATEKVTGDGVSTFLPMDIVLNDHPGKTVYVKASVQDAYGRTIDTLPRTEKGVTAKDDGKDGGGGSAFWG